MIDMFCLEPSYISSSILNQSLERYSFFRRRFGKYSLGVDAFIYLTVDMRIKAAKTIKLLVYQDIF